VIATCNDRIKHLDIPEKTDGVSYVVVHQVFDEGDEASVGSNHFLYGEFNERCDVKVLTLYSKGLSKSRNFGLHSCGTKFVHIMDDDVDINVKEIKKMASWMDENHIDVATGLHAFKTKGISCNRKGIHEHNRVSLFGVSSIDICLNLSSVLRSGIEFDEEFGLGARYPSGEEYVFLSDCYKANLKVFFFPACVGVHPDLTSGEDFYSTKIRTVAKRKMIKRVFGNWAYFVIVAFWLKKIKVAWSKGYFFSFTKNIFFR
tara:strand:+ start:1661 stop:2437 length:777 start_codon:yes stop_codon:yes gene_type:complete